jgi:hypothetical protein
MKESYGHYEFQQCSSRFIHLANIYLSSFLIFLETLTRSFVCNSLLHFVYYHSIHAIKANVLYCNYLFAWLTFLLRAEIEFQFVTPGNKYISWLLYFN